MYIYSVCMYMYVYSGQAGYLIVYTWNVHFVTIAFILSDSRDGLLAREAEVVDGHCN